MLRIIAAAEALGKLGDNSGLIVLEKELNSNDMDARFQAVKALGMVEDSNAVRLATKTMDDKNLKIRLGAAISLFKLESN